MYQYAAILGHQPHISLAELTATVPGFTFESIEQKLVALFSSTESLDATFLDTLGGTVLLAERITEADISMEDIPQVFVKEVSHVKKKVTFSLRCFGIAKNDIKTAYRKGKEMLKNQNRPCRYIGNEKKPAATALLLSADIVSGKKGVELFIIGKEDSLWVGKTIGVQNIDAYTLRDIEKPVRDTTVGLLPPKLAQEMLNFGAWLIKESNTKYEIRNTKSVKNKRQKKVIYTVLDPFCGTGVIPLECLWRGWHILASDVSAKAVNGCKKNIDWIRKEKKILKKDVSDTVSKHDARKPFTLKDLPDMVVTETSLGPALTKNPSQRDATKMRNDSEKLQAAFLNNAAETLPGVPLVCIWPFWRVKNENIRLEKIWKKLKEAGYEAILPPEVEAVDPARPSLLYQRKNQFVGREIVLLMPKHQE